jgi:competence protein ComEA
MKKATLVMVSITLIFLGVLAGIFVHRQSPGRNISLVQSENADESTAMNATDKNSGLININTATAEDLMLLPGVGETLAARIIAYREENGPFAKAGDICNVKGIGDKTYAKFADFITVGG